jgi:hypothetical protein
MISKIFLTGKTFAQTCQYVCQDLARSEVLDYSGVRGYDHQTMAEDFAIQHSFRPEREKPVFHGMLSFPPGEDPGDAKMVEIARDYLREIGMNATQYAVVKHTDKEHLHLHIIANRVNDEGITIGKGMIIDRGIEAARKLTREYLLKQEHGKNLSLTHREALHKPDATRYRLYEAIQRNLPGCRQMEDLEKRLLEEGITVRYRLNAIDQEKEGISFRIENMAFGGYQVDPDLTLRRLEQRLSQQRQQEERLDLELRQRQEKDLALEMKQQQEEREALEPKQRMDEIEAMDQLLRHHLGMDDDDETPRQRHSHGLGF